MSKKQNSLMRFSRTERLAQLSEQEIVIERKKREIQAKLEAQKKKQTEEALKKLESSREIKINKPGHSKKSWSGTDHQKNASKEKQVDQVKENLTNAFSNDGSFLDQFKKLSQTGLSTNNVDMQTLVFSKTMEADSKKKQSTHDKGAGNEGIDKRNTVVRDHKLLNDGNQGTLDSEVQFQTPSIGVQFLSQHSTASVISSPNDNTATIVPSNSFLAPQFQGGKQNSVNAFNSKIMQLNSSQAPLNELSPSGPVITDDSAPLEAGHNLLLKTSLASVQPPLPITQNIPPPSPIKIQNIPAPPILPSELPKLRSESISMTLKTNTVKKLEAIPNPLEVDQPPSSPNQNLLSFAGMKESSKKTFLNTKPILENVFPYDRESSKVSSALYNKYEDGQESGDPLDEKYHHWAELVARCGDSFEDSLRKRNQSDPDIRFLMDKNSKEYQSFRKLVLMYRTRTRSSDDEAAAKTQKLDSTSFEGSMDKIIPPYEETSFSQTVSSDEESCDAKGGLGSEKVASVAQDIKGHSNFYENQEDYLSHNKSSKPTPKEESFLPFQKQQPSKETSGENSEQFKNDERRKRKRKSRWGDAVPTTSTPGVTTELPVPKSTLLSQVTRSDPGLIQYARQTFGSTNLSEEDWKKAEDHYKINLLYQDMVKKRAEVEKLERQGKFKYEYDSDEDTEGGTWEHKLRQQEMQATQLWAEELTRQAAGKHHIGDFLPPEELERFMEKYNAVKEGREPDLSDYKEYKLKEDNVGYRLLQKMGWNEGQGLGQDGSGITNPVNKATTRHENQGLGIDRPDGLEPGDDEYDAYRKRMMLAYRFRPNPLNNPRRPYY